MRRAIPSIAALLLVVPPLAAAPAWLDFLLGHRNLEVITVTDASPAGRQRPAATPAEPQYYIAASLGYQDFGGMIGGIKEPPTKHVLRLISAELAKQGYLPATTRSARPSLVLIYSWGTLNADVMPNPNPDFPDVQLNRPQIVRFLGGRKVGIDDSFFNPYTTPVAGLQTLNFDAQAVYQLAREDFYVIVVAAYDYQQVLESKAQKTKFRHKPLWVTRIACPSLGFALPDVIPSMLAIGGPMFGRDTPKPVWVNASDKFKPNVHLGELQLIDYLKDEPLPVVEKSVDELRR